jgi:hypothetical protein
VSSYGGWVVCEEYKDALLAAWEEELVENKKKEKAVGVFRDRIIDMISNFLACFA